MNKRAATYATVLTLAIPPVGVLAAVATMYCRDLFFVFLFPVVWYLAYRFWDGGP